MLILDKTRINILVDVNFLIPTFQVVLIHINKVGNRINKVGHETTKWVNESTKWVNESTSWTAPNQPRGSRQLYASIPDVVVLHLEDRHSKANWIPQWKTSLGLDFGDHSQDLWGQLL